MIGNGTKATAEHKAMLADRIMRLREAAKLTQKRLGEKVGAHAETICQYESGRCMPSLVVAKRMAAVLGVTLDELMRGIE